MGALEDGVQRVTQWILGPGEALLNKQLEVGYDITSAENLRRQHEALELQCRVSLICNSTPCILCKVLIGVF